MLFIVRSQFYFLSSLQIKGNELAFSFKDIYFFLRLWLFILFILLIIKFLFLINKIITKPKYYYTILKRVCFNNCSIEEKRKMKQINNKINLYK